MNTKTIWMMMAAVAILATAVSCKNNNGRNNNAPETPGTDTTATATITEPDSPAPDPNTINGHKWVDMGTGVKWATTNIGANSPEEFGDYFACGELETKSEYTWDNYAHRDKKDSEYMIPANFIKGDEDNLEFEPKYDAARKIWGGSWRMPTQSEIRALRTGTTKEWVEQNGVAGYLLTSKKNGEQLFFPAAGYKEDKKTIYVGDHGYYWSSSIFDSMVGEAYHLYFKYSKNSQRFEPGFFAARCGMPIRPVTD